MCNDTAFIVQSGRGPLALYLGVCSWITTQDRAARFATRAQAEAALAGAFRFMPTGALLSVAAVGGTV